MPDVFGHVHVEQPSWTLTNALPVLADPAARTPCTQHPAAYDDDAPLRIRKAAARACRWECTQLDNCRALATQLGHTTGGVIAGRVLPRAYHAHGDSDGPA